MSFKSVGRFFVAAMLVYLVFFVFMPGWKPSSFVESSAYVAATDFLTAFLRHKPWYDEFSSVSRREAVVKITCEGELPINCRGCYSIQLRKTEREGSYSVILARSASFMKEDWQVRRVYEIVDGKKDLIYLISAAYPPDSFPDPALEEAIRDTNLIGLRGLYVSNRGIINLEGIQHCVDLTSLSLDNNEIVLYH